ncbi:MAG: S1C family serine protease [Gemmataceae bacterium]|nr:S1C family serine protease [Gemmataceae bacterium]MDW8266411.1 trypsin-like peptidase domain-containing protein [Gemmataceae bacterium]
MPLTGFSRFSVFWLALLTPSWVWAQQPFSGVTESVNKRMVKLFGSGGYARLANYGTGILVSPEGHILTVASHLLDTPELRVHLYDGRRYDARVLVVEPQLDAALLKINNLEGEVPYFDVAKAAQAPLAQPGDWVLAFSNQFRIATRDEPMSVQRGVIAAYSKLHGRRGIFEAPYTGEVYVVDAITNNPGAAGGALTTRKGELLGVLGKELRNTLSDTWMNYAVPIQALATFVEEGMAGRYKPKEKPKVVAEGGAYHGIILVPDVVERTPPFIEDVIPGSPAAKAGLKPDDLIVYIDGERVGSIKTFQNMMATFKPGTTVQMEVQRVIDRQTKTEKLITVKLELAEPVAKTPPRK